VFVCVCACVCVCLCICVCVCAWLCRSCADLANAGAVGVGLPYPVVSFLSHARMVEGSNSLVSAWIRCANRRLGRP